MSLFEKLKVKNSTQSTQNSSAEASSGYSVYHFEIHQSESRNGKNSAFMSSLPPATLSNIALGDWL